MAIDPIWIWIGLVALSLIVIVGLIARGSRRSRTESLREQFGGEYDHAVSEAGNRKRAERELVARTQEVEKHDIRSLNASERERYRGDWQRVEQHFIERPTTAVVEADELVADIMRVQGYPMGDFAKHAAHLSVKHPRVVEHYRAGHRVMEGAPGSASTEDMRQAMLHYRALIEQLLGEGSGDVVTDLPRTNEVASAPPGTQSSRSSEPARPGSRDTSR
ncbi:MAG TPA: hypothetical protein VEK79_20455 [Thermoanaerobaculia bacterium]|nr:hypothetical protein [Thermoanaerobaculia bacterium]